MNNNPNYNINNGINSVDNNSEMTNETMPHESYYNHKERKKSPLIIIMITLVAIVGMIISLWLAGAFTPMDREAEYNKLYSRVCNAAVNYANENEKESKKIPGKIVYLTTGNLIDANLVEASMRNYLTNEPIPATTDIRLEVLPDGTYQCHGFVWPGDDTVKPVIKLKGESTIKSTRGSKVTDPGAIASDDKDGDISDKIKRSGTVDIYTPGTYYINYTVTDRAGNISNILKRKYVIQ